jgi:4-alpha-glucanotransferase
MNKKDFTAFFEIKLQTLVVFSIFVNIVSEKHDANQPGELPIAMTLQFYLRFHTHLGQSLWISGNIDEFGNDDPDKALLMDYLNDEFWHGNIDIKRKELQKNIRYKYFLKNEDGELINELGYDRIIDIYRKDLNEIQIIDTWNHAGEYENAFFTAPFNKVLLKTSLPK